MTARRPLHPSGGFARRRRTKADRLESAQARGLQVGRLVTHVHTGNRGKLLGFDRLGYARFILGKLGESKVDPQALSPAPGRKRDRCPHCGNSNQRKMEDNGLSRKNSDYTLLCVARVQPKDAAHAGFEPHPEPGPDGLVSCGMQWCPGT